MVIVIAIIIIIALLFWLMSDSGKSRRMNARKMVEDHPDKYELHPKYNMMKDKNTNEWIKF